jgi:phosphohistidine swiveling domain-containing protein
MKKTLESHRREYYLVSITACFQEFFLPAYTKFFAGKKISEAAEIIDSGVFYWLADPSDMAEQTKALLRRIEKGEINLSKVAKDYDIKVTEYEKLIFTKTADFELEMLSSFYRYYIELFPIIAFASYGIDHIDEEIRLRKRKKVAELITKMRLRGERIHKDGEKKFIPKYTQWLSKNILTDYSPDDLLYVLYEEMKAFLENGRRLPTQKVLSQRRKSFIFWCDSKGRRVILEGQKAQKYIREKGYLKADKFEKTDSAKGVGAFAGKVTGRVRLILSTRDIGKFRKGEIIVSQMTDPHYLPIMKKAAAFVTDEGGLLCHAAIVARELKKPCVISTKVATKIFKDGDLVEIDANRGIIRKI